MQAARDTTYARLDRVIVPNLYYRDDIRERWFDGDADRLQGWGIRSRDASGRPGADPTRHPAYRCLPRADASAATFVE